ncbi:MAG TPA: ATP-binding cassette domain-containing protein [Ensifer sp.]|nr:ATP-binding cassette domain-containing protein [Ensifer sp.]
MIELEGVTVRFGGVRALDNLSVRMSAPVNGIIGPNGAGKTTTMNVISGFIACSGRIVCGPEDIARLPAHARARWGLRRSFQREQIANDLTVEDNLRVISDGLPGNRVEKQRDIERALELCGLSSRARVMADKLNMYERRLTDIARCLVGSPRLVMLDEPCGGLTSDETRALGQLIAKIHDWTGAMTLVIDHDVDLISAICTETLVLDFGKQIAFGKTADVLADPRVQRAYLGVEEVH